MKKHNALLPAVISLLLLMPPTTAKADNPLVAMAVFAAAATVSLPVGIYVAVTTKTDDSTETTETNSDDSETTSTDSDSEESGGENEGTDRLGGDTPAVNISRLQLQGWYDGKQTRTIFGSKIPATTSSNNSALKHPLAKTRYVSGTGIEYKDTSDEANVMLTPSTVKQVSFTKTRRTTFRILRRGTATKDVVVPFKLKINELKVSTTDIPATNGSATGRVAVLVDDKLVYSFVASVNQGQSPVFSGAPTTGATLTQQNDLGLVQGLNKTIRVKVPKNKRSVKVDLVLVSSGIGQRL